MTNPEETPQPEEKGPSNPDPIPDGMGFDDDLPEDFTPLIRPDDLGSSSRARRRRARRTLMPQGENERASLLEDLARRSIPSVEFFLFAFLSGVLIGAGYLLDSDALLLLGLLLAPLLMPWVGMTLAAATGSWRFFIQTLATLFVAFLLAFITSALVGLFNRMIEFNKFYRASDHSKLWWTDLLIVVLGAVLLQLAFVRGEHRPILPGIMLAYGLFLPVGAAGFGLGAGLPEFWPNGLFIFAAHLALATLIGLIVLAVMRFKAAKASGTLLAVLIVLVCLATLAVVSGLAGWFINRASTPGLTLESTVPVLASPTRGLPPSSTPGAPTRSNTPLPSETASETITLTSTPAFAVIAASVGGGAMVRGEPPDGTVLVILINGTQVEVLPEVRLIGVIHWVLIRTSDGMEGWVLQAVLTSVTPVPTQEITATVKP